MQQRPPVCVTDKEDLVLSFVSREKSINTARQALSHRRVDYSRVFEEDRLCDTLGTHWAVVDRWSHKKTRERLSNVSVEVWGLGRACSCVKSKSCRRGT